MFDRLVSLPTLLDHPNLHLEVVLCAEDHVRAAEPGRSRSGRRRRDPGVRHLRDILGRVEVSDSAGLLALLPEPLPSGEFTTAQLAAAMRFPTVLAQRAVFVLRHCGLIEPLGRRGNTPHYRAP